MPATESYPFKRLMVSHLFHGVSRIWWELDPSFNDLAPYTFQLQASYTGNSNALDWTDIGDPAINPSYMDDDTIREHTGKRLLTHYRLALTTTRGTYVSAPASLWGILEKKDWLLAQEMVRKERLRHGLVSVGGYLVRKMRYGVLDPAATDPLTNEIIDSRNRSSWGTAFKVGYHPPIPYELDFTGAETIAEYRGGGDISKHSSRPTFVTARAVAFPDVAKEDFWVDEDNDQRWVVHEIKVTASWRGVPLIYDINFALAPPTDIIYRIPVNDRAYDPGDESDFQPTRGDGCVRVDHDYPEDENLTYQTGECCGIEGANIYVFTKESWDGGARLPAHAVATGVTTTDGKWAYALMLNPGEYVVQFLKLGEYGPDHVNLTVNPPDPGPPPAPDSSSEDSSFSSSFGSV